MSRAVHRISGNFDGSDGTELYYQCWKPDGNHHGQRGVLIIIHGMAEHSDRYKFPIDYFSQKGFAVYLMDLRGHGNSRGRRSDASSFHQLLDDIQAFLQLVRKREKGQKIFLIGHSFGGQLVLNYGIRSPEGLDGIIVSSPNIRLKLKLPFVKVMLAPVLARLLPTLSLSNELDSSMVSHDLEVVRSYDQDKKVQRAITTRLANLVLNNQKKLISLAKNFHVPSLLMHAGDDQICSPEGTKEFYEKIPIHDKQLKIYKGFYHELFNEVEREKVFHDMEAWLEKRI